MIFDGHYATGKPSTVFAGLILMEAMPFGYCNRQNKPVAYKHLCCCDAASASKG